MTVPLSEEAELLGKAADVIGAGVTREPVLQFKLVKRGSKGRKKWVIDEDQGIEVAIGPLLLILGAGTGTILLFEVLAKLGFDVPTIGLLTDEGFFPARISDFITEESGRVKRETNGRRLVLNPGGSDVDSKVTLVNTTAQILNIHKLRKKRDPAPFGPLKVVEDTNIPWDPDEELKFRAEGPTETKLAVRRP